MSMMLRLDQRIVGVAIGLLSAATLSACDDDGQDAAESQQPGDAGKADDTSDEEPIVRVPADEPLGSANLKRRICDAIGELGAGDACESDFRFTVTEFAHSTQYSHTDSGEPVTLEMKVTAIHEPSGDAYFATLRRQLSETYALELEVVALDRPGLDCEAFNEEILSCADENTGILGECLEGREEEAGHCCDEADDAFIFCDLL
jgi:hypothetical protein